MVESFQIPQNEVGKWAGVCAAVFSLFQALMGIPWGRFSDKYGRKPAILLGLTSTMLTSLVWGCSKSLPMAIVARALAGAGNGNVGIIRTTVAEMVPFKELQPRAFSLMPLVWNIGSIFGPTIGGALANPFNVKPGETPEKANLFEAFPYLLPNLVSACFFAFGITIGLLFLHETLDSVQGRRDYGVIVGQKITKGVKRALHRTEETLGLRKKSEEPYANGETDPLLKRRNTSDDESDLPFETKPKLAAPSWREVLNRQAVINLIVYTLLAMHSMAFDQLIPVFMQHDSINDPKGHSTPYTPPLKFAGGFGLDHFQIGLMSTGYGIVGMVIQFFVFPPLARRYGILFWLKVVAVGFPIVYLITPFTALLPTTRWQVGCMFAVMLLKCLMGIFAFPCSTILLTNSASSLRTLGTLNGFATSASAIGRAAGPAMAGAIMSVGVQAGYVIAPWWFLAAVAIVAAIPVWWLVEGEGFGGDDDHVSDDEEDEEEEEDEEALQTAALEGGAQAAGKGVVPAPAPTDQHDNAEDGERAYGGITPLSRTNTEASTVMLSDDELDSGPATRATTRSRRTSGAEPGPPQMNRRNSRRVMRRVSIPFGMREGISRRYSSNLGQSFGSAGGHQ